MPITSKTATIDMTVASGGNVDHTAGLKDDHLGFRPYVEAVYSYLKNEETEAPFTISIEGDWGSGKSSFMKQLQESLEKDNLPTIKFNAWRHDKVETMWAAFALHFIKEMLGKLGFWQRISANLRLQWKRFDLSKGWFSVFKTLVLFGFYTWLIVLFIQHYHEFPTDFMKEDKINWSAIVPVFGAAGLIVIMLFFLKGLSDVTGNPFKTDLQKFVNKPNYEGNVAFIEEFHRDFDQTVDILAGKHTKVFVFIDDLDRADVPKSAELMQGLNMMISDKSKLIFIVGMDREKVAAGMAVKYKDLLPFLNPQLPAADATEFNLQAVNFGHTFLEKFIQLSFQIPKASPAFTSEFIDSLSDVADENANNDPIEYRPVLVIKSGKDSVQFREVIRLLAPLFEDNPRRIKQFVNSFRLKAHIANSTGLFNHQNATGQRPLTIPQLGKFIAFSTLVPQFVEHVRESPTFFQAIGKSEDDKNWLKNKIVADILSVKPRGLGKFEDYDMTGFNVQSLLQTSPVLQPGTGPAPTTTTTTQAPSKPATKVSKPRAKSAKSPGSSAASSLSSSGGTSGSSSRSGRSPEKMK